MRKHLNKFFSIIFITALLVYAQAYSQPDMIRSSGDLQIAIQKLNILGSILLVAAHPDDENTAALAYFSKARKYRSAYLAMTRGDGGQNLIGPEKGAEIGIIRTQELLEARKIDGAEQFFTRAIDFGYSKTPKETFEFWGKDQILADVVWIIRKFRPDVIISRFPPGRSAGHGHHTAAGILIVEAFDAAADPNKFPEQLIYVRPWRAKRIVWNSWRMDRNEIGSSVRINIGKYEPLLGKSYSEISAESRSMHKSQGFGSEGERGNRYDNFLLVNGVPMMDDILDGIDTSWKRVPGGRTVGIILSSVIAAFDPDNPARSIPGFLEAHKELKKLGNSYWVDLKRKELLRVIQSSAGLWMETIADDFAASPGGEIRVRTTLVNRSDHPLTIQTIRFPGITPDSNENRILINNEPVRIDKILRLPDNFPVSQPFWLKEASAKGIFSIRDQNLVGVAENPPSIQADITLISSGELLEYSVPLLFRWEDRVDGELYRPFEVRPLVTVNVEDKVRIFTGNNSQEIAVRVKSHSPDISGKVRLKGPEYWKVYPSVISFSTENKYEEKQIVFTVTPPEGPDEAEFTVEVEINGKLYTKSLVEISYPHIDHQVVFPESRIKAVKFDVKKAGSRVGYIPGAGDEVPVGLRSLGYDVTNISDDILENGDLSPFDAIVTGVRAYNTRESLRQSQPRLLEYVKNGGTLLIQYNVANGLVTDEIGPYPFTIGRDRVSVEDAHVTFLDPDHQLLNFPNKISQADFEGWVQERGLYFASRWDDNYETIIASHDPDEADKAGSILFARYGKGVFIYTGISWFRELPAGVPGAYRLFANLISAGEYDGK
jgi:LmbE family N-acetylglucosaminyl deacetylase